MKMTPICATFLAGALWFVGGFALAQDLNPVQQQIQMEQKEGIYGSHLMTEQERMEYRERMRRADTPQEREQIRKEHRNRMEKRAKDRGVTLPGEPPALDRDMKGGKGMGPDKGMPHHGGPGHDRGTGHGHGRGR
jgi:hypothetical protein